MRILLTGNLFHGYEIQISEGLRNLGHEVDILFNNIHGPFNVWDTKTISKWFLYGFLPYKLDINYYVNKSISNYNQLLQLKIRKNKYDLLLVIGGKTIFPETINLFPGRKAFWFLDSISRYESIITKLKCFDDVYFFEPSDIEIAKKYGVGAEFLPVGYSPKLYKKMNLAFRFDFSFIGSYYPNREEHLTPLLKISDNICLCGDFQRSKNKKLKDKIFKTSVSHEGANKIYNISKINLNIHHPQSKEGVSIRVFEIMGAGGFQLMERKKVAMNFFKEDSEVVFYDCKEEFFSKAAFYLSNDSIRDRIAKQGHINVSKRHSWEERLRHICNFQ